MSLNLPRNFSEAIRSAFREWHQAWGHVYPHEGAGANDHGHPGTLIADDDITGADWDDLTDGGETDLHTHPATGGADHDHTTAGDGGVLTDDKHDGFSEYADDTFAATPAASNSRLWAEDFSGLSSRFVYRTDDGNYHLLDNPPGNRETVGQGIFLGYIGNDAEHATALSVTADTKVVYGPFYCANDMTLSQGFMRLKSSAGTIAAKMIVYSDTAGAPDALLAESAELTGIDSTFAWREFTFSSGALQGGTSYWIGVHNGGANICHAALHDSFGADFDLAMALDVEHCVGSDTYAGGASNPFGAISSQVPRLAQVYVTGTIAAASLTGAGVVELATAAETTTGTDATRAVTPDGLAGSDYGKRVIEVAVSDPGGSAITTGDSKAYFRVPAAMNGWNLVNADASVSTVSSSGAITIMVHRSRWASATTRTLVDMLSTAITIDVSEFDSDDATASAINGSNDDVNTGDQIHIDIDAAGTGAKGLVVELTFQLP